MVRPLLVCVLASSPLLADVVPHCGGPEVSVQAPGQDCGHHGPRWRGDCSPSAACFTTDSDGAMCTAECASDADCAPLGHGFTCAGQGHPYAGSEGREKRRLCLPARDAAAKVDVPVSGGDQGSQ